MGKSVFDKTINLNIKNDIKDDDSYSLSEIDFSIFDGDFGFIEYEKKVKKQKQKKGLIRKKLYIPLSKLNETYELYKIINGVKTGKKTMFEIEIIDKYKKRYVTRINDKKLKIIAPTLLCDYYESRMHFN
jgi:hypothetical protein